jgi:hypothetical protein
MLAALKKFPTGQLVSTPGALDAFEPEQIATSLARHVCCDWGDLCEEDKQANDRALLEGSRLLSSYKFPGKDGPKELWIITEADRSVTTCLLPSEY